MADWKKLLDDAVSTIGDGAKAAGEGLRDLADDARKVAGIGRGRIEIAPDRLRHRLGDTIEGTVRLHLSEPVPARRLVVVVRARRKRNALGNLAARGRDNAPSEETVFEFESTIAGEQTFESGEHRFEIDLPVELDLKVDAGGLLGDAMRAAKFVHGMTHGQLRWTLVAFLDIPWKRNVSTTIDIAVREAFADLEEEEEEPRAAPREEPPRKEPPPKEPPRKEPPTTEPPRKEPPREQAPTRDAPPRTDDGSTRDAPPRTGPAEAPTAPVAPPRPSMPPGELAVALERVLAEAGRRGRVVIHERRGGPVDPASVMPVLARHPDLDPELLQFYALLDGLELVLAEPRVAASRYDTVDAARAITTRTGGALDRLDALLMHPELGPSLWREFCDDSLRVLSIPTLQRLLDADDRAPIVLDRGTAFTFAHVDELRATKRTAPWQSLLRAHEGQRWWAVRREGDGDPELLRWSELLALGVARLQ